MSDELHPAAKDEGREVRARVPCPAGAPEDAMTYPPVVYVGCPSAPNGERDRELASLRPPARKVESLRSALAAIVDRAIVLVDLACQEALLVASAIRGRHPSVVVLGLDDPRRPGVAAAALRAGIARVLPAPFAARDLVAVLEESGSMAGPDPDRIDDGPWNGLCGNSPAMRRVIELVARAQATRDGVLISGEPGTGREIVARAIHGVSHARHPFVKVDCAGDAGPHLEAQLFGVHPLREPGEGDGRHHGLEWVSRSSRLAEARGGTLFLTNVQEMPASLQARLARVLRDREAATVDDRRPMPFDVRPIAAVETSFDKAVEDGRVRVELFRRLAGIRISLPPLRARREDIPALADSFVRESCRASGVAMKRLAPETMLILQALPWRGNARELRGLIERLVSSVRADSVRLEDLLVNVRLDGGAAPFAAHGTLREARARFEREYIAAVLEQHHGRIPDAARALGIQRTNLYRKLRRLQVSPRASRS